MKTKFDGKPRMVNSFQIQELHCLQSLDSHYESAVLTSDLRASTLRSREFSLFASARFNTNPKRSSGFSGPGTLLGPSIPIATSSALSPKPRSCVDGSRVCGANEWETQTGKRAAQFVTGEGVRSSVAQNSGRCTFCCTTGCQRRPKYPIYM